MKVPIGVKVAVGERMGIGVGVSVAADVGVATGPDVGVSAGVEVGVPAEIRAVEVGVETGAFVIVLTPSNIVVPSWPTKPPR